MVDERAVESVVEAVPSGEGALGLIAAELVRRMEGAPLMQRVPARCTPDEQARLGLVLRDLAGVRRGQALLAAIPDVSFEVLQEAWPELAALLPARAHTHAGEWRVEMSPGHANGASAAAPALAEGARLDALPQPGGAIIGALPAAYDEATRDAAGASSAAPAVLDEARRDTIAAPPATTAAQPHDAAPPARPYDAVPSAAAGTALAARLGSVRLLTTLAVGLAILIYALDLTVVATAAPTIIGEFHSIGLFGWLFSAYSIPVAATTLLYGRLADVYGRKRLFSAIMIGFLLASVGCGLAPNMLALIAFRALQGLCAGAIFPLSVAIIADVYPIEQRARGFSIVPSAFAFASVLGPTAGGFITAGLGWRWIFFLNVPVVLIALGVLTLVYHESVPARRLALRDIDLPGAALVAGALIAALVAISIGGANVAWLSWQESLLWTCAVALAVIFVLWERRVRLPLLPMRVLRHRGLGSALLTIALLIWIVDSLLFFIPTLAQGVLGGSAQSAGIILIPLMLTWSLTALVSLRLGQRYGFRGAALAGCVALAAALITLSLVRSDAAQEALIVPMLLAGLGAGMINPNMQLLAQNSLSDRDQGLAGGMASCTLVLTAALVAPLLAALELGRLAVHFGGRLPDTSALLSAHGRQGLTAQFGAAYVHDLRLSLGAALHDVFSAGFIALVLVTVVVLVLVPSNAVARRIRLAPLSR